MKKSLFSFLMVAMVATITFAFAPKPDFADIFYKFNGTGWEVGTGTNCGGSGDLCQVKFDSQYAQYASLIFAQISNQSAGSFNVIINPPNDDPDAGNITVPVVLLRKLP